MGEALAFRDTPEFREYDARFAAWLDALGIPLTPDEFTGRPPRALVEIHRWVPQFAVLGRAAAFVTHAGAGGASEGLYQGVPMARSAGAQDRDTIHRCPAGSTTTPPRP